MRVSGCGSDTAAEFTLCADPTRIDLGFIPGDPIDLMVPILDNNRDPVEITAGQVPFWAAEASIRRQEASTVTLYGWSTAVPTGCVIVPGIPAHVRLIAASAETEAWQQTWFEWSAHWDLQVTPPGMDPQTIATGRIHLQPQYTQ